MGCQTRAFNSGIINIYKMKTENIMRIKGARIRIHLLNITAMTVMAFCDRKKTIHLIYV